MQFTDWIGQQGIELPTGKVEEWKYADLSFLKKWPVDLNPQQIFPKEALKNNFLESGHHIFCVNGRFDMKNSMPPKVDGLELDICQKKSDSAVLPNPFARLNLNSETEDCLCINIEDGVNLTQPLHVIYWTEGNSCARPKFELRVGVNSSLELLETFVGEGSYLQVPNTEIHLKAGAHLKYARHQAESIQAAHFGFVSIDHQADASSDTVFVSHGARFNRLDGTSRLCAPGANTQVNGVYLADQAQFVDHHTNIEHQLDHTESQQLFKGVLGGQARAVFNGRVAIFKDAQKSNSSQLNKNLMLTNEAEVDTKPELAIEADDVKAAHGATIGQISDDEKFYLMSRGITEKAAALMLGRAFAIEVLESFSSKSIKSHLIHHLELPLSRFFAKKGEGYDH